MIHLGEWARRITQDEHRDATACPFWGSRPEKQVRVEHGGHPGWGEGVAAGGTWHGFDAPWTLPVWGTAASCSPRAGQAVGT